MEEKKKYKIPNTDKNYVKKTVKFLPKDYRKVEELMNKSKLDFSNLVKKSLLKTTVIEIEKPNLMNDDLYIKVTSMSNNINQITKLIHSSIAIKNDTLISDSLYKISTMQGDINQIKKFLKSKNDDHKG
jgi:hypothetical protein